MVEDVVRAYGYLTLGSRLKRLGERLQAEVARLSEAQGFPVQAGQYPVLGALERAGGLTVNSLVETLGVSQPAVTRTVARLVDAGLVEVERGTKDQRVRIVALTPAGQALVKRSKALLWPAIEAAVRDLCENLHGPLLDQIGAIEDGLAIRPLDARVADLLAREGKFDEPA